MRQLPRRLGVATALTGTVLLCAGTVAAPAQASPTAAASTTAPAVPWHAAGAIADPDFSGIVRLSNCSGSVVRWRSSQPSDMALMLTNGHCVRFYGAHEVDVDVPAVRSVTLLNSDGTDRAQVSTTTLRYGTMDRTDVALYELDVSYARLVRKYDVHALTVSAHRAAPNARVVIISGFFRKAYRCHLNGYVFRLREGDWTWHHSLRYNENGCHMVHGTSGSPVLGATSRAVVGIHNTTNDSGEKCTVNNPCEIDRQGHVTVHQGRHYGEETWWFTSCLGADRSLHLDKPGCLLTKP
jgi:Trypsin-like peptidase domain